MNLYEVKLNTKCVVKNLNLQDKLTEVRLMELGIIKGTEIIVKHKSIMKKTFLIIFNSSCFTLKDVFTKAIEVEYA